jgi:hypothetical protein
VIILSIFESAASRTLEMSTVVWGEGGYFQSCDPLGEGAHYFSNAHNILEDCSEEGVISFSIMLELADLLSKAFGGVHWGSRRSFASYGEYIGGGLLQRLEFKHSML